MQAALGLYHVLQCQTSLLPNEPLAIMQSVYAEQRSLITILTCDSSQQVHYHNKSTYQGKKASNLRSSGVHSLQSRGGWTTELR